MSAAWLCACTGTASSLELVEPQTIPHVEVQEVPNPNTPAQIPSPTIPNPPVTVVGRVTWPVAAAPGHFVSAWSGTRVGVRFRGTGLVVRMADTDIAPLAPPAGGWADMANAWDVDIDGAAQPSPLLGTRTPTDITVAENLPLGDHEVWLTRQTEAVQLGRAEVFGVTVLGGDLLAPPAPRRRRIEVVGTSVETGLHVGISAHDPNEVEVPICPFHPRGLNQNRAWPKLTADALNADLINSSVQGAGLLVGFTDFGGDGVELPGFYPRADLFVPSPRWDPSGLQVDAVLSVAGWSDINSLDPGSPPVAARLQAAYEAFLDQLRAAQPNAMIYAVVRTGDLVNGRDYYRRAPMTAVLQAAVKSRRDAKMAVMELPIWDSSKTNCGGHPTWDQHKTLASAAASRLLTDLGW